uniref:Uncharacterized protein n=1 Tax=Panagrolaimus davidi TaxID=227884 RepID=A0A914QP58_9BILA
MTVDYNEFYNDVWPSLVKRVPAFKNSKVVNAWAMYNDVNTFDDLPILGEHLKYNNFYTMAGFGNYGPQMAIAAGKLYSERIFDSAYVTINVRKYDMRRIMNQKKYQEPLKMEGNLFKPNEIDADLRGRLEMLKKYANAEIHKCEEFIIEQEKQLEEYKNLRKKVSDFPKLLRREDWLPINDYAFIRGTYDNTNKFYTLLGRINDIKEGYKKQKELAKSRLEFAENLFNQEKSDVVEIREPYDDEKMKVKKEPKENVSSKDFEAIMSRLNELEKQENEKVESIERANEIKVANTVEVKKEDESENSKIVAPKGISQEEFENLIKRVDQMIESSDDEEGYEDEDISC